MKATSVSSRISILALTACFLASVPGAANADELERGDTAPVFSARAIDGSAIDLTDLRDRVVVLCFSQTSQPRSAQAIDQLHATFLLPEFRDQPVTWIQILSKTSDPDALEYDEVKGIGPNIIHDTERSIFGAYGVIVLPTVVVIDPEGRIAHVIHGMSNHFVDNLQDALRFALGRITEAEFEALLSPSAEAVPTEAQLKAERTLHLAQRLAERGMTEMAESKFREAIELAPDLVAARLGLGALLLARRDYPEAEREFGAALQADPESAEAALGLARVLALYPQGDLDRAEALARRTIQREAARPLGHFVLGLVFERRGDFESAANSYRTAAQLLLESRAVHAAREESPQSAQ